MVNGRSNSLTFKVADYIPRKFLLSIVITFFALAAALFCGAWLGNLIPANMAEEIERDVDKEIHQLVSQPFFMRALAIFIHNFGLSVITLVPVGGCGWMLFVTFNTGFFLGVFAQMLGGDPVGRLLFTLLAVFVFPGLPVAFFEFGAYILLFSESLYVSYLALTRSGARQRLRGHSWKTLLIYVVMLLVGAFIESAMFGV